MIWLKFQQFSPFAKTNPELLLICILITCSLLNMSSRSQNDCLSFKLKWKGVAKCLEGWYVAHNIPSDTVHELNWNELILLFITELMTSLGSLIHIMGAN